MKNVAIFAALALPLIALPIQAQQTFDFSSLDKLGAAAKNKTDINLNGSMLKMASGMIGEGSDGVQIKNLVSGLKAMVIRSYEFDGAGKYSDADLEPFRAFLKANKWNRIVDTSEDGEHSEIYVQQLADDKIGGLAIMAAERREVTVVYIDGTMNMDDIAKLSGNMGIPKIMLNQNGIKGSKGKK